MVTQIGFTTIERLVQFDMRIKEFEKTSPALLVLRRSLNNDQKLKL